MTTMLTRYEPFVELAPVREWMDKVLSDGFWSTASRTQGDVRPLALDVFEAENDVVVKAALPGFSEKEVDLSLENDTLTIHARHAEESHDSQDGANIRWAHRELWAGEYARSITLPSGVQGDKAEAAYADGVLTVRIPKAEAARPKQIKINAK